MELQSLGLKTEMIFHRFDGFVLDRGDYVVVRTPSIPGFYFGNLLLFFHAPKQGSMAEWVELFRKEFADIPAVKHTTFLWYSPAEGIGDISEFQAAGYQVDFSVVLTASSVHAPKKINTEVEIRPISTDAEWNQVIENQILSKASDFRDAEYRLFKQKQMARYRAMAEQGLGLWFGAYLGDRLVGDLGIYHDGTLGRFQSVETHPDFHRRGICGALVFHTAQYALREWGLKKLVMIADENYHAAKIYESVGFAQENKEYSAFWWDKKRAAEAP